MAESLGRRLLDEVEEMQSEKLYATLHPDPRNTVPPFDLPSLDHLLQEAELGRRSIATKTPNQPVLELASASPGGGTTHLLYHLTATAILRHHDRGQACVVILDADGHFIVDRLAAHIKLQVTSSDGLDDKNDGERNEVIVQLLKQVHIFRPQSLPAVVATLDTLTEYLFDATRHHSFDRTVAFVALDSTSTSYWPARAAEEEQQQHTPCLTRSAGNVKKTLSVWQQLTTALRTVSRALDCPLILTSRPTSFVARPPQQGSHYSPRIIRSLRPSLPAPVSSLPTLRLILQRSPVKNFPTGVSFEEAMREAAERSLAVEHGRFEAVVNEWQSDDYVRNRPGGFTFTINTAGLRFEEDDVSDDTGALPEQ